ncbi:MAG TPA: PLD nuclease N-terminal domain-containing protein [Propionibacteriaceae bacterium]|nr:PLD nuclease N-terminal domain-containing protein [Propionibacteriaceae bacterium]
MIALESLKWSTLPLAAQIAVVALVAAQLVLAALALVVWSRTPEDGFTASRWIWLAVILLGQALGPLIFLLFGRRPLTVDVHREPPGDTSSTLDLLYGDQRADGGRRDA